MYIRPEDAAELGTLISTNIVGSSAVRDVYYVRGAALLWIRYASGVTYMYCDVPESAMLGIIAAVLLDTSVGAYTNNHIRSKFVYYRED